MDWAIDFINVRVIHIDGTPLNQRAMVSVPVVGDLVKVTMRAPSVGNTVWMRVVSRRWNLPVNDERYRASCNLIVEPVEDTDGRIKD